MREITNREFTIAILIGAASAFLTAGLVTAVLEKGFGSAEAAGWVQAVGSVAAIAAAIWIMGEQHRTATRRDITIETLDLTNFLKAVRSEISIFKVSLKNIDEQMIDQALNLETTGRFESQYPPTIVSFPVYEGSAAALGKLDNDNLRRLIIATYGEIRRFFEAVNRNSEYLGRWDRTTRGPDPIKKALEQMGQDLRTTLDGLLALIDKADGDIGRATQVTLTRPTR